MANQNVKQNAKEYAHLNKKEKKGLKMNNLLKKFFLKFQKRKFLIKDDLKRQKINFVFNYLLSNYENKLRGKIDLPAFYYANSDIEAIIKMGKIDFAYELIKKIIYGNFKK